jgi:large subunit ribosomal protein L17
MKHRIKGRKLSRTSSHRKALLRNLTISLVKYELIKTTLPKAKELRPFIEKIVTMTKVDSLANRRLVLSILANEEAVDKLFAKIGKRVSSRNGGYTRILKYGFRTGDKAPMAIIEFVDKSSESDFSKEQEKQKSTSN